MKCSRCNEEVLLAEKCPYCGADVAQPDQPNEPGSGGAHRGTFRGRIGPGASGGWGDAGRPNTGTRRGGSAHDAAGGGHRRSASLGDVWRFFTSDKVATWKKFSPVFLLLYFLSPLDFVPDVIPLLGWFDDATIAVVAWRWLANEIAKHGTE